MTDIETTATGETRRTEQAKQLIGQAGQTLKQEAQSFASAAQDRMRAEAQKGTQTATKTLGDFANAVRVAGDQLAQTDQSPAARLVRQAADGLESLSRNLAGKQPEDLLDAVRDFGRRNPAAFIGGSVLVGLAIGRLVRATEARPARTFAEDPLAFIGEDDLEGPSEAETAGVGLDEPAPDHLGLAESSLGSTASPVGVPDDEGTSGETTDPTLPRRGGA